MMFKVIMKKVIDLNNQVVFGNVGVKNVLYDFGNDVIGLFRWKIWRRKVVFILIILDVYKKYFLFIINIVIFLVLKLELIFWFKNLKQGWMQ